MTEVSGAHEVANETPSPELSPLDIGEDFAPIRVPKAPGQATVSFSGLLEPPLILHEDLKEGCGGQLWPAGIVLGRYLLERLELLRGKITIELGAGGGLTGLGLALALQRSEADTTTPPLLITDLPILLPLEEQNIALNSLYSTSVLSASFPWGGPVPPTVPSLYQTPDVILAADCVYFEPAFPLLLETLHALLDGDSAKPEAICYFCMKKRRKADMRFISALKKSFLVEPLKFKPQDAEERNVFLYEVRAKAR